MPAALVTGPDHIVLRVKDPVASVDWYCKNLGVTAVRLQEYQAGVSTATITKCSVPTGEQQQEYQSRSDTLTAMVHVPCMHPCVIDKPAC